VATASIRSIRWIGGARTGKELLGTMSDQGPSRGASHPPPDPSSGEGPYAAADSHLRALAGAAEGFGSASVGGLHGNVYHVTSLAGICVTHKTHS
jgi:hypothetical protein